MVANETAVPNVFGMVSNSQKQTVLKIIGREFGTYTYEINHIAELTRNTPEVGQVWLNHETRRMVGFVGYDFGSRTYTATYVLDEKSPSIYDTIRFIRSPSLKYVINDIIEQSEKDLEASFKAVFEPLTGEAKE